MENNIENTSVENGNTYGIGPEDQNSTPDNYNIYINDEETLQFLIIKMNEVRMFKEYNMNYTEAEQFRVKIDKAKDRVEKLKKRNLKDKHESETERVKLERVQRLTAFNQEWESKIIQFKESSEDILDKISKRHEDELEQIVLDLEKKVPTQKKKSKVVLEAEAQMKSIARSQNYKQAMYIQSQIDRTLLDEDDEYEIERRITIERLINQKKKQQQNVIEATRAKINAGLNELNLHREKEIEKLFNKSEFMEKNLKGLQTQEENFLKRESNLSFINKSSMISPTRFEQTDRSNFKSSAKIKKSSKVFD